MDYRTRLGDRPTEAHINYDCPCGCVAGVIHDTAGESEIGECCCGRVMAVGNEADARVGTRLAPALTYAYDRGTATLPWGESIVTVLAVPTGTAQQAANAPAEKVRDPVCGMTIDPATAAGSSDYQGQTYYFCAISCKQRFDAEPQRFVGAR